MNWDWRGRGAPFLKYADRQRLAFKKGTPREQGGYCHLGYYCPVPSSKIIPAILDELSQAGVEDKILRLSFALGSHRAHSEADKRYLVGDSVYHRVRCIDSDETDCLHMGVTRRGTPVDIFRPVAEADADLWEILNIIILPDIAAVQRRYARRWQRGRQFRQIIAEW